MTLLKSVLLSAVLALFAVGTVQAKDEAKASTPAKSSASASADKGSSKAGAQIDLNSATEKELATLPKIGDARAKAIVQGRPYKGKDELVEKKIISQDVYDGIKDRVIAKQGTAGAKGDAKKSDMKKTDDKKADAKKSDDKKADDKKAADKK